MKERLIIFYKAQNIEINKIIQKYKKMKSRNIEKIRDLEEDIIKERRR